MGGGAVVASQGIDIALLWTALTLGLRHGIDWDHIAAITDVTATEPTARRAFGRATIYAAGHASVVLTLGSVAVLAGGTLPDAVDATMGRVVGATLVLLGVYVVIGLIRHGRGFQMRSRWLLVASLLRSASRRLRGQEVVIEHDHPHGSNHGHRHQEPARPSPTGETGGVATMVAHRHRHVHRGELPPDPSGRGGPAVFGIGMLHGFGAETPTQVVLFIAAAGAGGALAGELVLAVFTLGLLASNTAIALAAAAGFLRAGRHGVLYVLVGAVVATFSLMLGALYLLGIDAFVPILAG
jgi:hypothetical protein